MDSLFVSAQSIWQNIQNWVTAHLWNADVAVQVVYILVAIIAAEILYRGFAKRIELRISKIPNITIRRVVEGLSHLAAPLLALTTIFLISQITALFTALDMKTSIAAMKLLTAWIVIHLSFQFINNSFIRNIASTTIWLITAISIFGVIDETAALLDAAGFNIGTFRFSALSIIRVSLALFFLLYIANLLSTFLEKQLLTSKSLSRSLQVLIGKVIRIALVVMALVIGITSAGIDLSIFAIFSGAVGLGIGFGLQKVVSNLFSGLLLLSDQSIKPGDVIELEASGTFGWVNNMAARYTEIVTRDNKSYLIPNEEFITQRVVNWSHGNSLVRLQVEFGTHYKNDPHHVIEVATRAATTPERVVEHPKPVCWITEFGDSSINFVLRFWIRDSENGVTNVKGAVLLALWDAFKEEGIRIPYPHLEIHMHEETLPKKK